MDWNIGGAAAVDGQQEPEEWYVNQELIDEHM